jgi:hypothetical protein
MVAAVCTGVGGIITSYAALVRARHKGHDECERKLRATRDEAERVTSELHALRMQGGHELRADRDERGGIDLLWLLAVVLFVVTIVLGAAALSDDTQGPPGPPGPQGERGVPGESVQGPAGAQGPPGSAGAPGVAVEGQPGPAGPQGATGRAGENGANGQQGGQGVQGERGAPGPTCPPGTTLRNVDLATRSGGHVNAFVCAN